MSNEGIRAVFLSYASQDTDTARRICEGLRAAGIEVWFDQSELRGGDAWEHEIRRQIRDCALFIPIISAHTEERPEGYFRLEWKLAVDRSHLMAVEKAFLVPVTTDVTDSVDALVPDRFRDVQWTCLPDGEPTQGFVARIARLLNQSVAGRAGTAAHQRHTAHPAPAHDAPQSLPATPSLDPLPAESLAQTARATSVVAEPARLQMRLWLLLGAALLLVGGFTLWLSAERSHHWRSPLANARFTRLTEFSGKEQAATISRDGRMAAFLADRDGHTDAWITEIGSGRYRNLTRGDALDMVNPLIRSLGFSPDGSLLTIWGRQSDGSRSGDINIWTVPTLGGALRPYLEAGEVAWSSDGSRIVYHMTSPGDPMFVRQLRQPDASRIYVAPAGVHCHFPVWAPDDRFIYFARGVPPDAWDIWRIQPSGANLERITYQNSLLSHPVLLDRRTLLYLATDADGSGPWLYALDLDERVPHRLSLGLERYTSLAASADGRRLVATVANPRTSLWTIRLSGGEGMERTAVRISSDSETSLSPRVGPNYLLYVSWRGGRQSIWKLTGATSSELWSDARATVTGAPAIAPDGRRIAFTVAEGARTLLYVMDSDGSHARVVADSLALRGNPAWTPDGKSLVSAVTSEGVPHLATIYLNGNSPLTLVSEYSIDPAWSPDGQFLVYSGADVGTTFPLRAVAGDGRPYGLSTLILTRGARRVAFWRHDQAIVVLRGDMGHKNFWLVQLKSGAERQLTDLPSDFVIRDFDISPDGSQIVFDRIEESSEIALIDRAS